MASSICLKEPSLDKRHVAKALVSWKQNDDTQYLTKPNPDTRAITFNTKSNGDADFFDLCVPIRLKGADNKNAVVRICASCISSLSIVENATLPLAIGEALGSTAIRIDFTLKCFPHIIVHTAAVEPLCPSTKPSRAVLNAIHGLSTATVLSIYIEASSKPPNLQRISDGVSQGLFKSCSSKYQIVTLYGGSGGKLVELSDDTAAPPSYDETTSCTPFPPPSIEPTRKRRRQDTQIERDDLTRIWAELRAMKELASRFPEQCDALKTENEKRKQQCDALKTENEKIKQQCDALKTENEKIKQQNEKLVDDMAKLQEQHSSLEYGVAELSTRMDESADRNECLLLEFDDRVDRVEERIDFVEEGQVDEKSLETIAHATCNEMAKRLANAMPD